MAFVCQKHLVEPDELRKKLILRAATEFRFSAANPSLETSQMSNLR